MARRHACPKCGQSTDVELVSVAYNSGIHKGKTYHVDYVTVDTSTQTGLSSQLAPPSLPEVTPPYDGIGGVGIIGVVVTLVLISNTQTAGGSAPTYAVLGILLLVSIYFIWTGISNSRKAKKMNPEIRAALEIWKRSYICKHDGTVFDPQTGRSANIADFQDFLFR